MSLVVLILLVLAGIAGVLALGLVAAAVIWVVRGRSGAAPGPGGVDPNAPTVLKPALPASAKPAAPAPPPLSVAPPPFKPVAAPPPPSKPKPLAGYFDEDRPPIGGEGAKTELFTKETAARYAAMLEDDGDDGHTELFHAGHLDEEMAAAMVDDEPTVGKKGPPGKVVAKE